MKNLFRLWVLLLLIIFCWPLRAQENDLTPYSWDAAGLDLAYPTGWDDPFPVEEDNGLRLQLAQILVDSPDVRPPGIPIINITLLNDLVPDSDLATLLADELNGIEITADPQNVTDKTLSGLDALELTGSSSDELLSGIGRAAFISDTTALIVTGRAIAEQMDSFLTIFGSVVESIAIPDSEATSPSETYGAVWQTMRTVSDGDNAFLNLVGLALNGDHLYTIERDLGVIQINAATGDVLSIQPVSDMSDSADIAVDQNDTIYIADLGCACIFVLTGEDQTQIEGFSDGAPTSIFAAPDGRLYATNIENDDTISVRVFNAGVPESTIHFSENLFIQPVLSMDAQGQVIALTQYGEIIGLADGQATPLYTLGPVSDALTDIAVDHNNHFVITTSDQGISILDSTGEEIGRPGRLVPNSPLPGEMVSPRGAVIGADGTLYFADSDGSFGAITALRAGLPSDRIGASQLQLNKAVQGTFSDETDQQSWTYTGTAGQHINLTAVAASENDFLDFDLRLIAPDGTEIAYTDDSIVDQLLEQDGIYIIIVARIDGTGTYRLGISQTEAIHFDSNGVARVEGNLDDVFNVQRWGFEGQAGQSFTLTMQADALDPVLRLVDPNGDVLDENDDTGDPALGSAAQISNAQLPQDGHYTIEAASVEGEGRYELTIVRTG